VLGPGSVVAGRFTIVREAGRGGTSVVFEAIDEVARAPVAIKVVRIARVEDEDRFEREVVALADVRHPAVVRFVGHGTMPDGGRWLAMEWVSGGSLADRLDEGPLGLVPTLALGIRVAEALGEAHAHGIIHRDVTPRNLLLPNGDVEQVKIADFGIARVGWTVRQPTRTGVVLGTPGYMAPEQARGSGPVDARADVFSLGCVLHECLTGTPLFTGDHILAVLAKLILEDAPRIRQRLPEAPAALDELIAQMLDKDPERRPRSAPEVARALEAIRSLAPDSSGPVLLSPAPVLGLREQRLLSVVVARMPSGSDEVAPTVRALAGMDDPALVPVRGVVEEHDGRLEMLANGSLVATLHGRGSAVDQATRAARMALAMRALLPGWTFALAMGRGDATGRWPVGPAVDRAVALRSRVDGIAVDEVTADLLDARFELAGDEPARHLVAEHDASVEADDRRLLGRPIPCVGRERELDMLADVFHEAAGEPAARAVLVTGPAGIGKTRLRRELVHRLAGRAEVIAARGDALRPGAPFSLLGPALRRAAGVLDGEPLETRRAKILERVRRHVPESEALRVAELLGEIAGAPFPDEDRPALRAARQDPIVMGDQMRIAFEDWLAQECAASPLLIVLDDLQWGDLATVRFLDGALRNLRESPLMVLALARPEVHEVFPRLWQGRALVEVELAELGRKSCAALVRAAVGPGISDDRLAVLVQRSEGIPLHVEELVRAEVEGAGDQVPETVVALLEARLEALPTDARRVLRAASVLGRVFWRGALEELLGDDRGSGEIDHALGVLVDKEVVVRRPVSRFVGDEELAFRHDLLREAAYAMLTATDRTLGHRLAGRFLERAGGASPSVLAEHFERGQDLGRAATHYLAAARQALEANDFATTIARAESGVRCGAAGETLGALRLVQSEAHRWRSEITDMEIFGLAAMENLPVGSAGWFAAAGNVVTAAGRMGDTTRLDALAAALAAAPREPAVAVAAASAESRVAVGLLMTARRGEAEALLDRIAAGPVGDDPVVRARLGVARSYASLRTGDLETSLVVATQTIDAFEQVGDLRSAANMRVNRGHILNVLGDTATAEAVLREALATARRLGVQNVAALALQNLCSVLLRRGETAEAGRLLREGAEHPASQEDARLSAGLHLELARCCWMEGRLEEAEREAERAAEGAAGAPAIRIQALTVLVRVHLTRGDVAPAVEVAEDAYRLLGEHGSAEGMDTGVRLARAEALAAAAKLADARRAIEEARAKLLAEADRLPEELRRSFLAIEEHARTLRLAEEWGA